MTTRLYLQHGRRHIGTDPIFTDWFYVGEGDAPAFQNGWDNVGGSEVPMRFRFLPERDGSTDQQGIELQGAVVGGSAALIFTLPITLDYDLHLPASDSGGSYIVYTVKQSGEVHLGAV